jgi:hypothetical protein
MYEIMIKLEDVGGRGDWRVYGIVEEIINKFGERKLIEEIDDRFFYKKNAKNFIKELNKRYK